MRRHYDSKKMLKDEPYEKWNQFVDLLTMKDYNDLSEIQKVAYLCFWYDSEVENGGHLQYFVNHGISLLYELEAALKQLKADSQAKILTKAINVLINIGIPKIERVEEFVEEALEGKFDEIDSEYYDCEPTIHDLLEKYLEEYEEDFIIPAII